VVGHVEIRPVAWANVADLCPGGESEFDHFVGSGIWAVRVGHLVRGLRGLDSNVCGCLICRRPMVAAMAREREDKICKFLTFPK
jgi:hypothetical protein